MSDSSTKTPVTVIGGFLGAGKTTLLNHILRSSSERCAVLVNDFGAVNIDDGLIARHDGTTMTLTNGCVCCSIGDGFLETLGRLLDEGPVFDHIVIEASGVGDPWRIAEIALVEPALRLNAVIVVADASRIVTQLSDRRIGDTVRQQFERCDSVFLNKTDLVDPASLRSARTAIHELRAGVRIIETTAETLPPLGELISPFKTAFRADTPLLPSSDHEATFERWSYRRSGFFDPGLLDVALRTLPLQLLRLKGVVRMAGDDDAVVLQMVGRDWSLSPAMQSDMDYGDDIVLVGIGSADLPPANDLDRILDVALMRAALPDTSVHIVGEGQSSCR